MRPARHVALVIALLAAAAASAAAQSRPYRGLFGGGQPLGTRGQSLDLTLSGFGGWDKSEDLAPPTEPVESSDRVELDGPFGGGSGTLMYTRPGRQLDLSGYGSGFLGYFGDNADPWYSNSSAAFLVGSTFDLSPRTTLRVNQDVYWATDLRLGYGGGGIPGSDIPLAGGNTGFDNSLERAPSLQSNSLAELTYKFTQRSSLSTHYRYRYLYYLERENPDTQRAGGQDQDVGFRYTYDFSRYAAVYAGYAYRQSSREGDLEDVVFHDIDAGVRYNRSLSLSRKTTLSFYTGSTVVAQQQDVPNDTLFSDPRFFITGGAALVHEIGRTWSARTDYTRQVNFQDGFGVPSLQDVASFGVGGLLGRRTDVSAGVYWTSAAIGLDERNFKSWLGSAQIRTAITRSLAVYASSYYYLYEFGETVARPPGVDQELTRYGVRVGLTTWLPLWASRGTP